tara:strand:+ start:318 stop:743 length:426 start_codon:yes stop_codon:yes gene_type:complete
MSDYNLQIAWSGKDALQDSDPDKVVSGGDFNTEFLAVKTAVNSKGDIGGNSAQSFLASTPSVGDNSAKVATTAFVDLSFAKKASPPLTGTPTAPTASVGTDTTQIATTAFVQAAAPVAATASVLGLVKVSLSGTTLTISTS